MGASIDWIHPALDTKGHTASQHLHLRHDQREAVSALALGETRDYLETKHVSLTLTEMGTNDCVLEL